MNISRVLPMVKDLDGFMGNLTSVTSALQIAFDSTLLALFLSAALMLVQTLVFRRSEDLLARVDRWVVEHVLAADARRRGARRNRCSSDRLEAIGRDLATPGREARGRPRPRRRSLRGGRRVASSRGVETLSGATGDDLGLASSDSLRKGVATLGRIERPSPPTPSTSTSTRSAGASIAR